MDSIWKRKNNYTEKVKNNSQIQSGKDRRFGAPVFSFFSLFYRCFTSKNNNV